MNFKTYQKKQDFLDENLNILLKDEAKNETIIGIVLQHHEDKVNNWLIGRLENNGDVKIIFAVDDDKNGLLFYMPSGSATDEELDFLVTNIVSSNVTLNSLNGNANYSGKLANLYSEKTGLKNRGQSLIHTLKLEHIKQEHILDDNEKLVKLSQDNMDSAKLNQIVKDIHTDIYCREECSDEEADKIVNIYLKKGLYILTDNTEKPIFCHAVVVRRQITGCAIGAVISPKEYRGKGYGKKCIYSLCEKLLEEGNKFIVLHVDPKNASAFNVYVKIGFEFIEETQNFIFFK